MPPDPREVEAEAARAAAERAAAEQVAAAEQAQEESAQDCAGEAPPISDNALTLVSDASNKLMVLCGRPSASDPAPTAGGSNALSVTCDVGNKLMVESGAACASPSQCAVGAETTEAIDASSSSNALTLFCGGGNKLMLVAGAGAQSEAAAHSVGRPGASASETPAVSSNALSVTCGVDNRLLLSTSAASAAPAAVAAKAARICLDAEPVDDHRSAANKRSSHTSRHQRGQRQCSIARTPEGEGLGVAMVLLGDSVRISVLKPSGAVAAWNATQRPRKQLLPGAIIVAVNGVSGDASAMRDALKSGDQWDISFRPSAVQGALEADETDDDLEALDDAMTNSIHEVMSMASSFATSAAPREEPACLLER